MDFRYNKTTWFLLLLTVMTLFVFWPLYSGEYTLQGEAADMFLHSLSHMREVLLQGEWPLWNTYQHQGIATSVLTIYWNPIFLCSAVLFTSPFIALNALYLFVIFISGLGFFKFSGFFFDDQRLAVIGGLGYPLVGFFVVQSAYPDLLWAAAWLPLLLYMILQYHRKSMARDAILLAAGYFLFTTGTSRGFVIIGTGVIIMQVFYLAYEYKAFNRLKNTFLILAGAGFLAWRIFWLQYTQYSPSPDLEQMTYTLFDSLKDFISLFSSHMTARAQHAGTFLSPFLFHSYTGVLVLILAFVSLSIRNTRSMRNWRILCLVIFGMSVAAPALEPALHGYTAMSSMALTATMKILLILSLLILGLHGLNLIITRPPLGLKIFFIGGLITGSIGVFLMVSPERYAVSELLIRDLQLDLVKTSFFLFLAGVIMFTPRSSVRFYLLGGLVLAELGLSNYIVQDTHLYSMYPISAFSTESMYPEKNKSHIDLDLPVGEISYAPIRTTSLGRNPGTVSDQNIRTIYWPWAPTPRTKNQEKLTPNEHLRYPLFYYSKDETAGVIPSHTNFDDALYIESYSDHQWNLSILTRYEKQLVFNQNYHRNWKARIDDQIIPVRHTNYGTMSIPLKPGLHTVVLTYQTDGLLHIFWVTMLVLMLSVIYLFGVRQFPYHIMAAGTPFVLIYLIHLPNEKSLPDSPENKLTKADTTDFLMDYERHAPFWFIRPKQINPENSYNGYRSEELNHEAEYSATLQLHRASLKGKKELEYTFRILSEKPVEAGVVLKTYTADDDAYNIRYFKSLDSEQWRTIGGRFSLEELPGSLIKAEFYIWNNKKQDFLIDDIQVKLNP